MPFTSFASVKDLERRLSSPIDTPEDIQQAESILEIISAQIRLHGSSWPDPILAPDICRAVCIEAAFRAYINPEGFETERGDQATFQRGAVFASGAALTPMERADIASVSGDSGWVSVTIIHDWTLAGAGAGDGIYNEGL